MGDLGWAKNDILDNMFVQSLSILWSIPQPLGQHRVLHLPAALTAVLVLQRISAEAEAEVPVSSIKFKFKWMRTGSGGMPTPSCTVKHATSMTPLYCTGTHHLCYASDHIALLMSSRKHFSIFLTCLRCFLHPTVVGGWHLLIDGSVGLTARLQQFCIELFILILLVTVSKLKRQVWLSLYRRLNTGINWSD